MARPLAALLFLSPLLANAVSYGDHKYWIGEKCSDDFNSTGQWEWQPTACVDSFCAKPMGSSQTVGNALYCQPFAVNYSVPRASADTYSPNNPPQLFAAIECSLSSGNSTCPAGTSCTTLGGACQSAEGGCCWPTDTAAWTAASKAKYAAAADRSSYGAIKKSYEVCQYDFDCVSKDETCAGFVRGQAYADLGGPLVYFPLNNANNGGYGFRLTTGFCSSVDLPQCNTTSDCPTNYACGISNTCFPLNDSKVPASYFLTTPAATTAAATSHTPAPSTAAATTAAAGTICGAGLQACGAACYDPAQSSYTCLNGQLAQVHGTQPATVAPTTMAAGVTTAATQAPTTATDAATQVPVATSAAATTAATTPSVTLATTNSPVTATPASTTTTTGVNGSKAQTGAASSMLQHSMLPMLLAAAAVAVAL